MLVRRMRPDAKLPTRQSEHAAGYDLTAVESKTAMPHQRAVIKTGIAIEPPVGTYARIAPRSGLAAKCSVDNLSLIHI